MKYQFWSQNAQEVVFALDFLTKSSSEDDPVVSQSGPTEGAGGRGDLTARGEESL